MIVIFYMYLFIVFFFFFQAEDGIRDDLVTGVQTCALPISAVRHRHGVLAMAALRLPDLHPLAAVAGPRADGGGAHGWGQRPAALLLPHAAPSGAAHGGGGDDRDDLPAQRVRRDRHHHGGRGPQREHQPDLPDLQTSADELPPWRGPRRGTLFPGACPP